MICQKCGAEIAENSAFCTKCGAQLEPAPVPTEAVPEQTAEPEASQAEIQPAPKKKKTGCIIAAVVAAALLVIGVLVFVVGSILAALGITALLLPANTKVTDKQPATTAPVGLDPSNRYAECFLKYDDYVLPESGERYLCYRDVEGLTEEEAEIAILEMAARQGAQILQDDAQEYFAARDWYAAGTGEFEPNIYETANALLIGVYREKEDGNLYKQNNKFLQQYPYAQDYAVEDSDSRNLKADDLKEMTPEQLILARNEIYARKGCIFNSLELQTYFYSKPWYLPFTLVDDFDADALNEYEQRNISFIQMYEMRAEQEELSEDNPYKAVYEEYWVAENVFEDSSERLLENEDVFGVTKEALVIARNEIYARHGYAFSDEDLMKYFLRLSWYQPEVLPGEDYTVSLSQLEEENVARIKEWETMLESGAAFGNITQSSQHIYTHNGFCYHVPVVELPDVDATGINNRLYEIYYGLLEEKVFSDVEQDILLGQMTYSVGRRGDVICVAVRLGWEYDLDEYAVHNFSATTGEELSNEELIRSFDGMGEDDFYGLANMALEQYWDNMQATMEEADLGEEDMAFFQEQREKTLDQSNLYEVIPMAAANGELNFIGKIYSMAGADYYYYRFDQEGNLIDMICDQHQ